jgi:hypothetical protein
MLKKYLLVLVIITNTMIRAQVNCVPSYTTGCSLGDKINLFRIKGESGAEININTTLIACNTPSYVDTTDHTTIINLTRGKSYWGQVQCGFEKNYITIWIDGNDNGLYENNERIANNLLVGTTLTNINLFIPLLTPTGNHTLRVRNVYYDPAPVAPTDPCSAYTWGETKDFRVNIAASGSSYTVASYSSFGACYNAVGKMTVDPASLSGSSYIPIVDSLNALVAQLYPNGNDLGTISTNYYLHNGPVRQTISGQYYLNRNFTISVTKQPTTTYNLRLPYKNTELNALIDQLGSGVTSQFDLAMTKITGNTCLTNYISQSPLLYFPTGFGTISGDRFVDITGINGFSTFFLHGGSTVLLPLTLSSFYGEVTGQSNTLYWNTASEQNNHKFIIETSIDGSHFTEIGKVLSKAINGNSNSLIHYSFIDLNPVQSKQYYRLKILDNMGSATYSQIITLKRIINGKINLEIVDIRPNPTSNVVFFNLLGTKGNVNVSIRDISGKLVIRKGSVRGNNFSIDLSSLANGTYILEATDVTLNEKAFCRVVKQ